MQVANLSAEMLPRWEPMWEFHDLFGLEQTCTCFTCPRAKSFRTKLFYQIPSE